MSQPRATYRLQLTAGFGFEATSSLVPYLRDLGISHLYLSPILQARPGSTHGYDVIDPRRISEELGGADGFSALAATARAAGMGIVLDIVPNHMAASEENPFWADPALRERFFDIDPVTGRHRRFFDIDDLAGVRVELPEVFEATHELVLSLVRDGIVDGLRVDHPDGLADPVGYLGKLRANGVERAWVEKILEADERMRDWPVSGTVGYEFLNDVCALFVEPEGRTMLTAVWERISGDRRSFAEVAFESKLEQVERTFWPEVERLDRGNPPISLETLWHGLASLPVYRTYVDPDVGLVAEEDRLAVDGLDPELQRLLLLEAESPRGFVTRFQQTTPAVMAKGVEDTAFYRYGRLIALNEVGGDPGRFGLGVERFHAGNVERAERFPLGLLTTQTHDAKRSADVRARIGALSGMASDWATNAQRWIELHPGSAPDAGERYFLLQTLVGAWPIELERVEAYVVKALREAKRNTSWIEPDQDYERAVLEYARALLADRAFLDEFEPFAARLATAAERAALGQVVLKLTSPGVPDIYQGDELPYRALVDPDNRRPVDWGLRRRLLASGDCPKLWMISRLLALRARRPEPFAGSYEPLDAGDGVCAYVRGGEVLVAASLRNDARFEAPASGWREVIRFDEHGLGVWER